MSYVEGFVIPVPKAKKKAFEEHAREFDELLIEYGALRVVECWGVDVPHGKQTDFYRSVAATDAEVVCFSWIEWPDQDTRETQMAKVLERIENDPRFDMTQNPIPFDGARMIFGGFQPIVDLKGE